MTITLIKPKEYVTNTDSITCNCNKFKIPLTIYVSSKLSMEAKIVAHGLANLRLITKIGNSQSSNDWAEG